MDIKKELREWIIAEEMAGRHVDEAKINDWLQVRAMMHNSSPREEFNGLSPMDMHTLIYDPFSPQCVVKINTLSKEQYERIPLIRQALFLLNTLAETELKLTPHGWLPLKIVAQAYPLGRPVYIIELTQKTRINEYEVKSLSMARGMLEMLKWVKTKKGKFSLTEKGKKAMKDIDAAANELLQFALLVFGMDSFDCYENVNIGNAGLAYSVWLLNKFGDEWHSCDFYQEHYAKVVDDDDPCGIYELRIFSRLFYWLGIVDVKEDDDPYRLFHYVYRKTELLSVIFSFK